MPSIQSQEHRVGRHLIRSGNRISSGIFNVIHVSPFAYAPGYLWNTQTDVHRTRSEHHTPASHSPHPIPHPLLLEKYLLTIPRKSPWLDYIGFLQEFWEES
jgi:hypothetical protein